jgi:hypothetical protein
MHHRPFSNEDSEVLAFPEVGTPLSPARRAGQTEIIQFPFQGPVAAASMALEDAMEPDTFESLGSIAVRIVADWNLPRIRVVMTATGGEAP